MQSLMDSPRYHKKFLFDHKYYSMNNNIQRINESIFYFDFN